MSARPALDLNEPDDRAVYMRRLALALGAPPESVDEGVRFSATQGREPRRPGWLLDAGVGERRWCRWLHIPTRDRISALAAAWPSKDLGQ